MATFATIEKFYAGEYPVSSCATETDFYALWHKRNLTRLAPIDIALAGAFLADRLPWAFTAGYQATLQSAFPTLPDDGWAAFAATEDTKEPDRHPGTTLVESNDGFLLNGNKAWVAHSRSVDHLIITINDPGGDKRRARGLIINSDRAGVVLSHREKSDFLSAMSQGFANFDNVEIDRSETFEFEAIRQFGRSEAKFVTLAAGAFIAARLSEASELQDRVVANMLAVAGLIHEPETSRQVYASVDREFQTCVDLFEKQLATNAIPDYDADRRMFRMYTDRIQRRREYAKKELAQSHDSQ
jgi:alkylation response protein AidB-like acyl-CoA dehydrogenase